MELKKGQPSRYKFATHTLKVDCVAMGDGGVARVGLLCECCFSPHDMFMECTYDDLQYMVDAGYMSPVKEKPKKKEKKGLECLFGEPQE